MRELTSMTPFAVKLLCRRATGQFVPASIAAVSFAGGLRGRLSKVFSVGGGESSEVVEFEVGSQARHGPFVFRVAQFFRLCLCVQDVPARSVSCR